MIFVEILASLRLRFCLQVASFHFSEITCVSENLDERFFVKSLLWRLFKLTNGFNSSYNKLLLADIGRDHRKLYLLFLWSLLLNDWLILDRDSFLEFSLVNHNALVCTEQVKADFIFAIFFNADIQRVKNLQLVLEHLSCEGIVNDIDVSGSGVKFVFHEGKNGFCLKQFFNEAHVTHHLEILVVLYCYAEHDRSCLSKVHPEVGIFTFWQ